MDNETKESRVIGEKIGRNELCPCGSGKKFKKCCLGTSLDNRGREIVKLPWILAAEEDIPVPPVETLNQEA